MSGPKVIYLAPMAEGFDSVSWVLRWREHGEINRSRDYWRHLVRYEQDSALPMPPAVAAVVPGPVPDGSVGGTGQVWYRSVQDYHELGRAPSGDHDLIRNDELETFGTTVENFAVTALEETRRERQPAGVKLVTFARDPRGRGREAFWRSWRTMIAADPGAELLADATSYIENAAMGLGHPLGDDAAPADRSRFPDYDAVIEIGFEDVDHLTRAVGDARHVAAWEAIGAAVSDDSRTVLVARTELFNELLGHDWVVDTVLNLRRSVRGAAPVAGTDLAGLGEAAG
jgi:hypothetical protein